MPCRTHPVVNRGFRRMFGRSLAEVQGRAPIDFVAPPSLRGFCKSITKWHCAPDSPVVREEIVVGKTASAIGSKVLSNPYETVMARGIHRHQY